VGVAGNTAVVIGKEKIATWNLATGNARATIDDSVRIITFDHSPPSRGQPRSHVSISTDLSRIVTMGESADSPYDDLEIYDVSTGRCLARNRTRDFAVGSWFTSNGREIWGSSSMRSSTDGWRIIEDNESGVTKLRHLEMTASPPGAFPWQSSRGYEVTNDGWILSPTQKRLLWLPHNWRSEEGFRTWGGRFLGLLHFELPEIVILEILE